MATYQKRAGSWRVQVRLRGQQASATFDTKREAEDWAAEREAEIRKGARRQRDGRLARTTVTALFERYKHAVSPGKRGGRWEAIRLEMLARDPVFAVPAAGLGGPAVAAWRDARLRLVSAASVNRELNLISHVFTKAIKEWGEHPGPNPVSLVERPKNPPARRQRWRDPDLALITRTLGWDGASPPATPRHWVAWCLHLAVETAMRKGEILGITEDRVHPKHVELVEGDVVDREGQTKNGEGGNVPLSSRARALLDLARGRLPVPLEEGNFDKVMREARREAGLFDLHFHDSRREGTTRLAPRVRSPFELARITRHKDPRILYDYFAPDAEELSDLLG